MNRLSLLLASILVLAVDPGIAASAPPQPRLGMNLAGPSDWMTELPFVDVFRTSRPWISQKSGASWGLGPELDLDEWGWVRKLEPGCFAEAMLCTISGGHFPGGTYTVLYEGQGKLEVGKSARIKESQAGRLRVEVDSSRGGFSIQLKETNSTNYIRNIRVIMPGFEESWMKDPFHPAFLQRWKGFACFRFMDWMHTNGSEQQRWSDRPTLRHATFSKRGVPVEWMVELCNRQQADAWFCMPHQADDDYVRNFSITVRDRLDPRLKIYVEYSNEVWNWQFKQAHYASERGVALGLAPRDKGAQAAWYYTAVRSLEIFKIWEEVLGGRDRLVRVLPSQAGNTAVSEAVLGFRNAAAQADALAIAPYMPYSIGRGKTADLGPQMKDWTVDQMLDHFEKTALPDSLERIRRGKAVADKFGVKLIAYEGGQHMVAFLKDQDLVKKVSSTMHACNRHPRMGDFYRRYYEEWAKAGGDLFAVFSSTSGYSNHGAWGLAEFYDSAPKDYPKLKATLETARKWGQPAAQP